MYIQRLSLSHLRCFDSADVSFTHPDVDAKTPLKNINVLLGDNGAGKTSILRALAIGVLGELLMYSGFVPYRLVRRTRARLHRVSRITVEIIPSDRRKRSSAAPEKQICELRRHSSDFEVIQEVSMSKKMQTALFDEESPAYFLAGYGSTRRVESSERYDPGAQEKVRRLRYRRLVTLFEDHAGLIPMSHWLPTVQLKHPVRFSEIADLMNKLLAGQAAFTGKREGRDYVFDVDGNPAPFPALSDGFRAFIGWVSDLLYHMNRCCPRGRKLRTMKGVVLVDEIDLHLHPDWQRTVLPQLSAALPALQFVLTTHSPIVTGTLHPENIWTIGGGKGHPSQIKQLRERVHGLSADQVLLSAYFNLRSARAVDAQDALRDLSRRARAGDEDAARAVLELLAHGTEDGPPPRNHAKPAPRKPSTRNARSMSTTGGGAPKTSNAQTGAPRRPVKTGAAKKAAKRATKTPSKRR